MNTDKKGFSYLGGGTWNSNISRDERFFCAHLFSKIISSKRGVSGLVELINIECGLTLDTNAFWELGYEVCFYRDFHFWKKHIMNETDTGCPSNKRTFDLCLFSENEIVIVEAKAYQAFDKRQMDDFLKDIEKIPEMIGSIRPENIFLIGLCCDSYKESKKLSQSTQNCFDQGLISWKELAEMFKTEDGETDRILARADDMHRLRLSIHKKRSTNTT